MAGKCRNDLSRRQANIAAKGFLFVRRLQRRQLVIQHVLSGKEVRLSRIQPLEQQLPRAVQIEDLQLGSRLAQSFAIITLQGRAADDQALCLASVLAVETRQGGKPPLTVFIVKGFTPRHLGDVTRTMMLIRIDVVYFESLGKQLANKGFPGTRNTHDEDAISRIFHSLSFAF